jgi:hypothetical protein
MQKCPMTCSPTPRYIPRSTANRCSNKSLFVDIYSSNVHNNPEGKQFKCPSNDDWMNKMWSIHILECYSATQRKEVLTHALPQRDLENIILNKLSQRWAPNCDCIYVNCAELENT